MYPILVVDGPDAQGKSFLFEKLSKRYDLGYYHATYAKGTVWGNNIHYYHTTLLLKALEESLSRPVYIDRLWLSENAYAPAFRGGTKYPLLGTWFESVFMRYPVLSVLAVPFDQDKIFYRIEKSKQERTEMWTEPKGLRHMIDIYHQFTYGGTGDGIPRSRARDVAITGGAINLALGKYLPYDYDNPTDYTWIEDSFDALMSSEARNQHPRNYSWCGAPGADSPKVLLPRNKLTRARWPGFLVDIPIMQTVNPYTDQFCSLSYT